MSTNQYVNLNEVGAVTQAGRGYGTDAQDGTAESQNFRGRMEQSQGGLRGRAGGQFTSMTGQHSGNLRLLANQFADQAYRAVRGEQAIVTADEEGFTAQQTTASAVDTQTSAFNRQINY